MALQYITCCVNSTYEAIRDLVDNSRAVSYRTAYRRIGRVALAETFPSYDWHAKRSQRCYLPMKADWHVSYHKGRYLGQPVYFVRHSAIEYIFGDMPKRMSLPALFTEAQCGHDLLPCSHALPADASSEFTAGWLARRSEGRPTLVHAAPDADMDQLAHIADRIDLP